MICQNCNFENNDSFKFCMNCGTKLEEVIVQPSKAIQRQTPKAKNYPQPISAKAKSENTFEINDIPSQSSEQPSQRTRNLESGFPSNNLDNPSYAYKEPTSPEPKRNKSKKIDLLVKNIAPAEGEISVRSYHCSYYQSRLLGLEAEGYLGVTNKRVLFQAQGSSYAGNSVIQSEVPIMDVSGISSYKGVFFSLGYLLQALLVSALGSSVASALMLWIASNARSSEIQTWGYILGFLSFIVSYLIEKESLWKPAILSISASFFGAVGGGTLISSFTPMNLLLGGGPNYESAFFPAILAFAAGIYSFIAAVLYARRPTFSLAINSKGGSSAPISISGASGIGIFDISAGKALTASPATDSETMLKELGAVVMDIQTLGDLGISKWKSL